MPCHIRIFTELKIISINYGVLQMMKSIDSDLVTKTFT